MTINFNSNDDLSRLFFGGTVEEEVEVPVLNELGVHQVYKSGHQRGQKKYKKGIKTIRIKGLGLKPSLEWRTKKRGIYQTNEKILQVISQYKTLDNMPENVEELIIQERCIDAAKIAKLMLQIREKEKMLNTYYTGWEKYIHTDSCVHGQFNHCATDTGRTSSSKPNLQNLPR